MRAASAAAALLVSGISCTRASPPNAARDPADLGRKVASPVAAPDGAPADGDLGRSMFEFGLTLQQTLARDRAWASRNALISPCSLSEAFAMIYAGARGETAREIAATLHYGHDEPTLRAKWATLRRDLAELAPPTSSGSGAPLVFLAANALWTQTGIDLAPAYRDLVAEHYAGAVDAVDFARAPEQARARINGWVKERTRGLVPELFPSGSLGGSTALVVVNTAYLRGAWEEPFPRADTRPEPFEKLDGGRVEVPTMHRVLNAGVVETSDYQAMQLRYVGDRLSLVVILPARGKFAQVEQAWNAASLSELVEMLPRARRPVRVSLPRFAISTPFSLAPTLAELGMKRAFRAGAELGGMMASSDPALFLGEVRHQVHLAVDEEQTEAAAATGVVISYGAAALPVTVRVDRPFLLGIHDKKTGALLFWGRVVDPASGG